MLNLTSAALKVFLALDPCDMRKSFNGLHILAADQPLTTPARDALFVFTDKRRNRLKLRNLFTPAMKLVEKKRTGSKVARTFDHP